ncbi:aegerolysin type hemolysin [Aspergillus alliaceus]|nr:aegerolysin type hemolysin [Aspergillus alliaceus]KAB8234201.1 aegerolysin type hemolysin [Aspergillus alliaceus]
MSNTQGGNGPDAYAQWIGFDIYNSCPDTIQVSEAYLKDGKFYRWNDKDIELSWDTVNQTRILPNTNNLTFGSCGRANAAVGTEGEISFEVDGKTVAKVEWDCPWTPGSRNWVTSSSTAEGYGISHRGDSPTGAIGTVNFEIYRT